jgi:hypothetical protein
MEGVEGALHYGSGPDAPPILLGGFLHGTAARQGDAEANLAEGRSFTALNGISQDGLERPIALRQDHRTNLGFGGSGLRQTCEDLIDAVFHQLPTAFRLCGGGQGCTKHRNHGHCRECCYRGSDMLPLMLLHVCDPVDHLSSKVTLAAA